MQIARFCFMYAALILLWPGSVLAQNKAAPTSGDGVAFFDCDDACPAMVSIPGHDASVLGSPDVEPGRLPSEATHNIAIKPFALAKYEVSVREYLACVSAKSCPEPEWREPGSEHHIETGHGVTYKALKESIAGDDQPIVGISWENAAAYARYLADKTGKRYRLPSESEWEHAARAGTRTPYWWGFDAKRGDEVMACCRGCGSEKDAKGFVSVKSLPPNPWGLHNMFGNVWEWVADYYCEDYAASPQDGSARSAPTCPASDTDTKSPEGLRIFRGGSCFYDPRQMRASMRLRNWPSFRNQTVGFRVARDLAD